MSTDVIPRRSARREPSAEEADVQPALLWRLVLLAEGLCFHIMLLGSVNGFATWFPPGSIGYQPGMLVPVGLLLAFGLEILLMFQAEPQDVPLCSLTVALGPLPLYVVAFAESPGLATVGVVFCLLQAALLLRPRLTPTALDRRRWSALLDQLAIEGGPSESTDMVLLSCLTCVLAVLLVSGYGLVHSALGLTGAWILIWTSVGLSLLPLVLRRPRAAAWLGIEHGLLVTAGLCLAVPAWREQLLEVLALRQTVVALQLWLSERGGQRLWRYLNERPFQLLVSSFALVIAAGTVVLTLPKATRDGAGLPAIDALFTATSATCVTGLAVVDTGTVFSAFGQVTILALIQVGGLGIMTISTFLALLFGRSLGLREEFAVKRLIGEEGTQRARRLLAFIVGTTMLIEGVGALLLAWQFHGAGYSWRRSAELGVFHSVSAFCNAGFALFPDSLVGFSNRPLIPLVISGLIILGGLGFAVVVSVLEALRRHRPPSLYAGIVLWSTAALCVGGAFLIWLLEHNRAFRDLNLGQAALHAWFQSVTARTAGFNTVELTNLAPSTILFLILLMFIGAAPGSTGGGIKVTTFVVLLLAVRGVVQGRTHATVAGRRLGTTSVVNAAVLAFLAMLLVWTGTGVLLAAEDGRPPLALLFEAVSAFGTVGLSLNQTPQLGSVAKLCLIVLMYVGRIGPLSLLLVVRPRERSVVEYPAEEVAIG